ncbi:hypothetical protein SAMN04488543_3704 [Friedmanniella luteola]|uniref:Uncharacterized protein n=1 Tax=Friedmanniella luteola TaxID=546871 RepID=A0A1H1ZDH8_9ACTN|nr:hypothetical protein [Friedmanniella luteola]SDT31758.1 hypothetical protein SAMN04488543_3704 [Friedmanniella luteola]
MVITTWERDALRPARRAREDAQPAARRRVGSSRPGRRRGAATGRLLVELAQACAWARVLGG